MTAHSAWERVLSAGEAWEIALSAQGRVLSAREAWELPAWEITLSARERVFSAGEAWELPAWGLPARRLHSLPGEECYLPGKPGNCLPER